MRKEWLNPWVVSGPVDADAGSLTSRRLMFAGITAAVAALVVGLGLAALFTSSTVAAGGELADRSDPAPPEILDAVAVTRDDLVGPAPIEHLTVVHLAVSACGERSTGSGVLIADDLLLTAAHVVGDAGTVRIDHRGVTVTGEVLGALGDGRDVALVEVDAPLGAPIQPAPTPPVGDPLTLVGHAGGGPRTATVGPVVEIAPAVATLAGGGEIVGVDASIEEGISGGVAVDADGAVVGLVVAKETATDVALVVALPDLADLTGGSLVPGTCRGSA